MSALASAIPGVAGGLIAMSGSLLAAPKKVRVPEWVGINARDVQAQTIEDNLANLDEAVKLSTATTEMGAESIRKLLELASPGALAPIQKATAALARGEIPQDIQDSVLRSGAARNLALGVPGTTFGANLTLRDLGLTSMQAQQQGLTNMTALAGLFSPAYVAPSAMFFTPQQRADMAMWDAEKQWQRDYMAAQVAAQPGGWQAALGNAMMVGGSAMAGGGFGSGNATNPAPMNVVGGGGSGGGGINWGPGGYQPPAAAWGANWGGWGPQGTSANMSGWSRYDTIGGGGGPSGF